VAELDVVNLDDSVPASYWRVVLLDIKRGDGVAVVTLRSGVQLTGKVDRNGPSEPGISLKSGEYRGGSFTPDGGWHIVDFTAVAAITGKVDR